MDNETIKAIISGVASLMACGVWMLSMRAMFKGMAMVAFMLTFMCLMLSTGITRSAIDNYLLKDWVSFWVMCSLYIGLVITPPIVLKVMGKKDGGL